MPGIGGVGGGGPPEINKPGDLSPTEKTAPMAEAKPQVLTPKQAVQAAIKMIMGPAIIKQLKNEEKREKRIAKGDV